MNTKKFLIILPLLAFQLIAASAFITSVRIEILNDIELSGKAESQIAKENSNQINQFSNLGFNSLQLIPVSNSPQTLFMKSIRYGGVNFSFSKNSVGKNVGSSGKIQIKILIENVTTLNVNSLGYGKISLPYLQDIGLTFNGNGKFNLNPFSRQNPGYRIYGLGNIEIAGNLLAVCLDMSEGAHSRISGNGKVSAFINPGIFEKFHLRK